MPNLTPTTNQKSAIASQRFTPDEIQLLKDTYFKDLNDTQIKVTLKQAEALDLNPFKKEIYAMIVKGKLVIVIGIDGFRKVAHKSGKYLGCKIEVVRDSQGKVYSAIARVEKLVHDHVGVFESEVLFKEFFKPGSDRFESNWEKIPVAMLRKTAEAHAIRMAFPDLGNVYEESEVGVIERSTQSDRALALAEKIKQEPLKEVLEHPQGTPPPAEPEPQDLGPLNEFKGVKLKDVPHKNLALFVDWCDAQEKAPDKLVAIKEKALDILMAGEKT